MDSLKLALRFSYKPNTLGLCGRKEPGIYELLKKDDWTDEETDRVKDFIRELKVLYAYLDAIGRACGKSPFDEEVVSACIIGWDKWDRYGEEAAELLKENLKQVALPKKLDEIAQLPAGVPLTHNFHTLYFGAVSKDIPRVLSFADRCKVSLGTVVGEGARYNRLLPGLELGEGYIRVEAAFFDVKPGDRVFLHHGVAFEKASRKAIQLYEGNLRDVIDTVKHSWE